MPDEPDPPRKIYALGKKEFVPVNPPASGPVPGAPAPDVQSILKENLSRANAAGLNELAPHVPRPSRRKRDYWTLMILVNGGLGAGVAIFGLQSIPGISAVAGMILFSVGLTWVMWLIMDNY